MKISLKKKNLKTLKSAEFKANNFIATDKTKMINGGGSGMSLIPPTITNCPIDNSIVDAPRSVSPLSDMVN